MVNVYIQLCAGVLTGVAGPWEGGNIYTAIALTFLFFLKNATHFYFLKIVIKHLLTYILRHDIPIAAIRAS